MKIQNNLSSYFKRNGSTFLAIISAIGVVGTTLSAIKATPKAMTRIKNATNEKGDELTTLEKLGTVAPVYLPTTVVGMTTIACIFGANILSRKQQASIASAYALICNSYQEYKEKVKELYGEDTHQSIIDAIARDKTKNVVVSGGCLLSDNDLIVDEDDSELRLFYDEYSGRSFESTLARVIAAEYHFNRNFVMQDYCEINEWYSLLGLKPLDIGSVGWSGDIMREDGFPTWIDFNHRAVQLDDGLTYCVIELPIYPVLGFDD